MNIGLLLLSVIILLAAGVIIIVRAILNRGAKGLARIFWSTERKIRVLILEIGSENDEVVSKALSDLISLGTASNVAAPYLFSLLDRLQNEEKRSALRRRVLEAIIASEPLTCDAAARSVLEKSIDASDRHERADALLATGYFAAYPEKQLSSRFVTLTRDPELVVRVAATHALASMAYDEDPDLYGATDLFVRERVPAIWVQRAYRVIDSARDLPGVLAVRALGSLFEPEASILAVAWALSPSLSTDEISLCVEVLLQRDGYNANPRGTDLGCRLHVGQANAAKLLGAAAGRLRAICGQDTLTTVVQALVYGQGHGRTDPYGPDPKEYCAWALGMYRATAADAQPYLLDQAIYYGYAGSFNPNQDDARCAYLVEAIGRIRTKDVPVREILLFLNRYSKPHVKDGWEVDINDKDKRIDIQCLLALTRLGASRDIPKQAHHAMINRLTKYYKEGRTTERLMLEYLGLAGERDPTLVPLSLLETVSKEGSPLRKHALRAIARIATPDPRSGRA